MWCAHQVGGLFMNICPVETSAAPLPVGPYSQAFWCGELLFVSGQIPVDPKTGLVCGVTILEQAPRAIENMISVLTSQGLGVGSLVKTTVYMRNMDDFSLFNQIYSSLMGEARPARSVVAVSGLPKDVLVEIEAVACR